MACAKFIPKILKSLPGRNRCKGTNDFEVQNRISLMNNLRRSGKLRKRWFTNEALQTVSSSVATAVLDGDFDVVSRLLSRLSANQVAIVLRQRFSDAGLTPLLLLPYSVASPLPSNCVDILKATEDHLCRFDISGNTILHLLVRRERQEDLVTLLPLLAAILDATNFEGRTALQEACLRGQAGSVKTLLMAGADVNFKSWKSRLSALHFAVLEEGYPSIVQMLLECPEIEVNAESVGGQTPLDMATNEEVKSILIRAGALTSMEYDESSDSSEESEDDDEEDDEEEEDEADDVDEDNNVEIMGENHHHAEKDSFAGS